MYKRQVIRFRNGFDRNACDLQHACQDVAGLLRIEIRIGLDGDFAEFLGFGRDTVAHGPRIGEDDVGAVVIEGAGHGATQSGIGEARVILDVYKRQHEGGACWYA